MSSDFFLNIQSLFVDSAYQVTDPMVQLLNLTGIVIKGDPVGNFSFKPILFLESRDITEVMQAVQGKKDPKVTWLRPSHKERWQHDHLEYLLLDHLDHQSIIRLFYESLNQDKEWKPEALSYKGILLLGTSLHNFFNRVRYLNTFYNQFCDVPIIVLTGNRLLDSKNGETYEEWLKLRGIDKTGIEEKYLNFPKIGPEMVKMVLEYFNLPYQICMASAKPGNSRATTKDTMEQWLKQNPEPGQYLAISSQPFIAYQHFVIHYVLQQSAKNSLYDITLAGPAINPADFSNYAAMSDPQKALNLLDTLARILYSLHLLRFSNKKIVF